MDNNATYQFEGQTYVNPDVSRDERLAFIDNLRAIQGANNAQIASQTQNLGTNLPSSQGGLGGSESYFARRYQTPQVDSLVADLNTAAQSIALSDVLNNARSEWSRRYSTAKRSAYNRSGGSGGSSGGNGLSGASQTATDYIEGLFNTEASDTNTGVVNQTTE